MKEWIQKLELSFRTSKKAVTKNMRKNRAQSMVEFALLLPVLLILFTGMVELGFMLNTYLSVLDATRQAGRKFSNSNPLLNPTTYNEDFGENVFGAVKDSLAPGDPEARQLLFNPAKDDVLVSVIAYKVTDTTTDPDTATIKRWTTEAGFGVDFYSKYHNYDDPSDTHYTDGEIIKFMNANSTATVNAGLLIVEVYYSYESTTKLPFLSIFASDADPIMLYASTVMPLVAIKPD